MPDAQDYLRNLLKQWRLEERAARRRRSCGMEEMILLSLCDKSQKFGMEFPAELKEVVAFMDPKSKLASLKRKLTPTPHRVAIQQLQWAHEFLSTQEPDPLPGLLKRMETHIEAQVAGLENTSVSRGAEQEIFFLVELYALAFSASDRGRRDRAAVDLAHLGQRRQPVRSTSGVIEAIARATRAPFR